VQPVSRILVGTAGWSIPRLSAARCPGEGTHLQRYSRLFNGAEINSSFYRSHAAATYAKWANATSPEFRFAVKLPRLITHEQKLRRSRPALRLFLRETEGLSTRRGPLLVQLPPSLHFEPRVAGRFFEILRAEHEGLVVCEPRHETWFAPASNAMLTRFNVARVAADPPPAAGAESPAGWPGIVYFRLHGSPRKYWSQYDSACIDALADTLRTVPPSADVWCMFDNTASGAAFENAWQLHQAVRGERSAQA